MTSNEQLRFGSQVIEQSVPNTILDSISTYIRECPPSPHTDSSLTLIDNSETVRLFNQMAVIEQQGQHFPFSHALTVASLSSIISAQLNALSRQQLGTDLVDEPLVTTSALLHDVGNVIYEEDIERLGLGDIDITSHIKFFPETASKDLQSNHILRTIAFIHSLGGQYREHAHTAAHSIYHLIYDSDVSLERLLLILSDFSVVNRDTDSEDSWPRTGLTTSLVDRLGQVMQKHSGPSDGYIDFYLRLEAVKSNLEQAGVYFSLGNHASQEKPDSVDLNSFLKLLTFLKIKTDTIPKL